MTSIRFQAPIAFDTADGRGVPVETLDGARLKRIDVSGTDVQITWNDENNEEATVVIDTSGGGTVIQDRSVVLSNADLKALDRTYVEIIPAPGARQYIQLHNVWMRRRGADVPNTERGFYWALSEDTVLADLDIAAGSGRLTQSEALMVDDNITAAGLQFRLDTWPGDEYRHIFVGSEVGEPEIDIYGIFTSPDPDSLFTPDAPWAGTGGTAASITPSRCPEPSWSTASKPSGGALPGAPTIPFSATAAALRTARPITTFRAGGSSLATGPRRPPPGAGRGLLRPSPAPVRTITSGSSTCWTTRFPSPF